MQSLNRLLPSLSLIFTIPCQRQTQAAQQATFSLAWKHALTDPYEPMAMGIVAHADTVVVGLRDCPGLSVYLSICLSVCLSV